MESELLPATRVNHTPATVAPVTPMEMLAMAVQQGADLEKLEKLMGLQERWEANEARKAFVAALTEFKRNPPTIVKDKLVAFGNTKYKHAELDQVSSVIGKALSEVGISHRWDIEQQEGRIRVTCILTHSLGHSECVSLEAPPDNSGQKNSIQAIASAVTYLQRYTLLAAAGVATGDDQDGRPPVPDRDQHLKAIKEAQTMESLKNAYATAFNSTKDQHALKDYIAAKDARKAELQKGEAK